MTVSQILSNEALKEEVDMFVNKYGMSRESAAKQIIHAINQAENEYNCDMPEYLED